MYIIYYINLGTYIYIYIYIYIYLRAKNYRPRFNPTDQDYLQDPLSKTCIASSASFSNYSFALLSVLNLLRVSFGNAVSISF